ncbi:MAG: DUF3124 domain-containing protein [Oscillatoriales cyanobacterium C42_A2020_001]|nr:DUF3124 domain-containing protein [Leptolyngbyaceae cyanobacterium C42_A2020_001]
MRTKLIAIGLVVCIALSAACTSTSQGTASSANKQSGAVEPLERIPQNSEAVSVSAAPITISQGQIVYVPVYSHIYHGNGQEQLLTVTLSIRNTSLKSPLFIRSVRYYNSAGKRVKEYTKGNLRLAPLATTEFLIPQQDASGGSGANFIVEWVAEQQLSTPIIEAVMISTSSQQGISFVTSGRVIQEILPTP